SIPLAPEIERLRRAAGLQAADEAVERVLKLRRLLGTAVPNVEEALPYYGALLSIPPCSGFTPANLASPRERERMLLTLADALVTASRVRPVLMIAEDVQWVDPTSIELLERIVPRLAKERILS